MSDLHNRRDFLKTSALAALGSAAALNSRRKAAPGSAGRGLSHNHAPNLS